MKVIHTLEFLHGMASVRRYSQTKLVNDESVLEHTGFVGVVSYFIALHLMNQGEEINLGVLFAKAMAHDMEEVVVGDIPRPTKYHNERVKSALREVEKEAMDQIMDRIDVGNIYVDWITSKEGIEGEIVATADLIAVVYKAWQEIHIFGNKSMSNHIFGLHEHINSLIKKEKSFKDESHIKDILFQTQRILSKLEEEL